MISTSIRLSAKMGAALRRRRGLAGGALLGRRRLRLQAQDQPGTASSRSMSIRAMPGARTTPLGLDPFRVSDGVLSIVASRTPPELRSVLFNNEYISGILTTQGSFAQKYGYFEIRAKIPVGAGGMAGVLDARRRRRLAAGDRRDGRPRPAAGRHRDDHALADSGDRQKIATCGFDFLVPDAVDRVPRLRRAVAARPHHLFHRPQAGLRHQGARSASTIRCT